MKRSVILSIFLLNCISPIEGFGTAKSWVKQRRPLPIQTVLHEARRVSNPKPHEERLENSFARSAKRSRDGRKLAIIPPTVQNGPLAFLHVIKADVLFVQILKMVENFFIGVLRWLGEEDDEELEDDGGRHGDRKLQVLTSRLRDGN